MRRSLRPLSFQPITSSLLLVTLLLWVANGFAQDLSPAESTGMRSGGKIYIVIGVLALIWLGFGIYLFLLERRIQKMEGESKAKTETINQ